MNKCSRQKTNEGHKIHTRTIDYGHEDENISGDSRYIAFNSDTEYPIDSSHQLIQEITLTAWMLVTVSNPTIN
jgi:hypothetical protein